MGIILVTRATKEQGSRNKAHTNCAGIILVTRMVILSRAKNLSVSKTINRPTNLEILRYTQDDTLTTNN